MSHGGGRTLQFFLVESKPALSRRIRSQKRCTMLLYNVPDLETEVGDVVAEGERVYSDALPLPASMYL